MTLPLDHSTASKNSHSDSLTGLERGKMIGLGLRAAISSMTGWLNALCKGKVHKFIASLYGECMAHLHSRETEERRGLHVANDFHQVLHRSPVIVLAGED